MVRSQGRIWLAPYGLALRAAQDANPDDASAVQEDRFTMTRDRTKERAPDFRKGAHAAALAEVDGEFELPRDRQRSSRIIAAGPKELLCALAEKAMRVLEDKLDIGDSREQGEAAQVLLAAWTKVKDETPVTPELSPEERKARLLENFRAPDPELLAAMLEAREEILKALER
jgi:hypothetical protein